MFSAAYRHSSGLLAPGRLKDVTPGTSGYALEEDRVPTDELKFGPQFPSAIAPLSVSLQVLGSLTVDVMSLL